jgi:hypothetical protein
MKRALAATVFGGLLIFAIPQAASAESMRAQHEGSEAPAEGGHDAAKPAAEGSGQPKQDAPGEGKSHFDKKHHDDNVF